MARVLLTGATGFIGRQIMRGLNRTGTMFLPVVRTGKECLVAGLPNVEGVISTPDLFAEDESWWAEQCRGIDIIIHAAWYVEPGKYLQAPQNMDCLIGSLNLAMGAAKANIKRFVGVGSCFEYDLESGVLSVESPLKPLTPYAAAKVALYHVLSQWFQAQSIAFTWCRLFYLYGEGEDDRRLVPYIRKQLENGEPAELTSGNQIRDFIDVTEAGQKIADVALSDKVGPVNVCSGIPVTVKQIAEKIADEFGRKDLLRFGARPDNLIDPRCVLGVPNS